MKCKYCNVLLDEGAKICPVCRKKLEPEDDTVTQMPSLALDESGEAVSADDSHQEPDLYSYAKMTVGEAMDAQPKRSKKTPVFIVCGVVLFLAAVTAVLFAFGVFTPRPNDIHYKDNYTVSDQKVLQNANKVVATMCDRTLTNGELQVYYWVYVSDYLYENQYYLSAMGLDYSKPFHEQTFYFDESLNWQQAFLSYALDHWYRYTCLYQLAVDAGYKLDPALEQALNDLPEDMAENITDYGYSSLSDMLTAELGPTCTIEMYVDYMRVYYTAMGYYSDIYESIDPTMGEIEAFFIENEELLANNKITKDSGYLTDVRHILFEPKDTDEDQKISEAEWEVCRQEAQAVLDQWLSGDKTEESFAALANAHSADPGSNKVGGLYTDVAEGTMVDEFDEWLFEEGREIGQHGLVKTQYGYHIMYFSGSEDIWIYQCREGLREEGANKVLADAMNAWPIDINYKNIVLSNAVAYS